MNHKAAVAIYERVEHIRVQMQTTLIYIEQRLDRLHQTQRVFAPDAMPQALFNELNAMLEAKSALRGSMTYHNDRLRDILLEQELEVGTTELEYEFMGNTYWASVEKRHKIHPHEYDRHPFDYSVHVRKNRETKIFHPA